MKAAKGKVTLLNDSGRNVEVRTYNENDAFQLALFSYETLTVASGDVVRLQARGENFINVHVESNSFTPSLGKSYVYNGTNLIEQS